MSSVANNAASINSNSLSALGRPIVYLAREYAQKGLSLKYMAFELQVDYSSLKTALRARGYAHPVGINLVGTKIKHESGWELKEYIELLIAEGVSRNSIAKELEVDNKTLQAFADRNGMVFPISAPIPKNFTNIIAAIRRRMKDRRDLFFIEANGKRQYIAAWAKDSGVGGSTIKKRLALGWTAADAVSVPVGSRRNLVGRQLKPSSTHPWRKSYINKEVLG